VGNGPFSSESPADNLISLQFFLLAISVPLLLSLRCNRGAAGSRGGVARELSANPESGR
jgi:hypothetical protein